MCVYVCVFSTELYYVNKVAQENYYTKDTQLNNVKHPFFGLYCNNPSKNIFCLNIKDTFKEPKENYLKKLQSIHYSTTCLSCFSLRATSYCIAISRSIKILYSQTQYISKLICFMYLMPKIMFCKRKWILTPEVFDIDVIHVKMPIICLALHFLLYPAVLST